MKVTDFPKAEVNEKNKIIDILKGPESICDMFNDKVEDALRF